MLSGLQFEGEYIQLQAEIKRKQAQECVKKRG